MDSKTAQEGAVLNTYILWIYGDTVIKIFFNDFIKKLLDVTANPFWVDVLKSRLYLVTSYINYNLKKVDTKLLPSLYGIALRSVLVKKSLFIKTWYDKGVNVVNEF